MRGGAMLIAALALATWAPFLAAEAQGGGAGGGRAPAASRVLDITAPPAFVVDHEPVAPAEAIHAPTQGVRLLLLDMQHDSIGEETAYYQRQVMEAAGFAGLGTVSQLIVPFDPAFQRFEVNHVRVTRDGVQEDRRNLAHLDYLRREQGLELQMITGALTATLRLDDVRVGDVVDIAFTVYGSPPAFEGRDARTFPLAAGMAVERFALRSRWGRNVRWTVLGDGPQVEETRERGSVLLEVEPQPLEAPELEAMAPPWTPTVPFLAAASFGDWEDVAAWARPFYEVVPNPEVAAIAEEIAAENATKAAQVAAALRFVQQEVRYFALVLGEGGYVPAPVEETLRTRSGDCKAKTLLFLSLLKELGVDASAALVHTTIGRALPQLPPAAAAFDHVIVRVSFDGETYWLDPTLVFQGGALGTLAERYFGYALPLAPRARGLEPMKRLELPDPAAVIKEAYDLSGGVARPATVRLETIYTKASADLRRQVLAVYARSDIEKTVVEQYRTAYGDAALVGDAVREDDLEANRITEAYEITLDEPFETRSGEPDRRYFEASAFSMGSVVLATDDEERKWPVAVLGPAHVRHEIVMQLPEVEGGWDLAAVDETIENVAFRFRHTAEMSGLTYTHTFELETLAETVEPADLSAVLKDQERMADMLTQHVWYRARARETLPDLDLPPIAIDLAPAAPQP